jgi:hypothetical protein
MCNTLKLGGGKPANYPDVTYHIVGFMTVAAVLAAVGDSNKIATR